MPEARLARARQSLPAEYQFPTPTSYDEQAEWAERMADRVARGRAVLYNGDAVIWSSLMNVAAMLRAKTR